MFNFSDIVVFSLFSLGFGYNVGKPEQTTFLKVVISLIFASILVNHDKYLLPMGLAFIFGMFYSKDDLFEGFFSWNKERRNRSKEEKKKKKQEGYYQAEQEQQAKDYERRRKAEESRRSEEARNQRKAEEDRKAEKNKTDKPLKDKRTPQEILGLTPVFTQEELREAYKRESNRSHPDKWVGKPKHIKIMMDEEQKLINWAYNKLK